MFGFIFISKKRFELEKRKAEKQGFRVALTHLKDADAILYGQKILSYKVIKGKIVILGDMAIISHCYFKGRDKDTGGLLEFI